MHQTISDSKYLIQHKELQRVAQDFYRRNKDENVHQPLCIDYPNVTSGIRELSAKTYIKSINRTSHCHHRYPITRHTSSVLKSNTQSNITKPQRARLNSSQEGRGGETPCDPTIITKITVHQDRAKSRIRERERDQTHSY